MTERYPWCNMHKTRSLLTKKQIEYALRESAPEGLQKKLEILIKRSKRYGDPDGRYAYSIDRVKAELVKRHLLGSIDNPA